MFFKNPMIEAKIPPKPLEAGKIRANDSEIPNRIVAITPQFASNHATNPLRPEEFITVAGAGVACAKTAIGNKTIRTNINFFIFSPNIF
jgi:hypothetical protein